MAENTNYIGVSMGLDVSDLKAGLSAANKQIQLANSEFKAASSGMDDWTKSTEGITAKVKQLDTVLKAQKSKLAGLTAEYEKVAKEQGEGSEAARKLKVQINNQQAVVNKTQKEFDNYTETLKQAEAGTLDLAEASLKGGKAVKGMGDDAKDAGGKMGGLGGVAKGVVGGIAAVGAAAVGAVAGFLSLGESTREVRENMNKLETGFTTAGHSAEDATSTYKALYGVLGDEGQATEAAAHLAQLANNQEDLTKWTDIATGVYATFGDSLPIENLTEAANETAKTGKITGGLADALNWAGESEEEFQAKLDAASSEQERQALITETLNGLYSEQSDKFKELNGDIIAAREADAALSQALAELGAIAEPIMTTLKLLAVDLLENIKPFVELIGTGLKGALEGTAGSAETLAEGLGGVINTLVEKATTMLPTVLNMILELVPKIAETILNALPQLLSVVGDLAVKIIEMLGTVLPQIIQKITEIIPLLLQQLGVLLPQIVNKIIEVVPLIITALVAAIPQLLLAAIQFLMAIVQALPTIISNLLSSLPSLIDTIITTILGAFPMLIDAAIKLFMAIVDAIPVIIQALITNLPAIINTIIDGLLKALPLLLTAAIQLLMAIIDALPTIISLLVKETPAIVKTIITTLLSRLPDLIKGAIKLLMGILEAIPELTGELIKELPTIISTIVEGLIEGIPDLITAGGDLLGGLFEGLLDPAAIWKNVKKLGKSIKDGIADFFDAHSPARLMIEDGENIAAGVGVGMVKKGIPAIKKDLAVFGNYIKDNIGGIKSGLSLGVSPVGAYAGAGAGAGGRVVNIDARQTLQYNGNMSLKEVKQREREHYVSIKTKLKAEGLI